jgi:hypothetical protein
MAPSTDIPASTSRAKLQQARFSGGSRGPLLKMPGSGTAGRKMLLGSFCPRGKPQTGYLNGLLTINA